MNREPWRGMGGPVAVCALVGLLAAAFPLSPGRAEVRPNIVLVFIDDLGWGDFSCFGNKAAQTPNIDRLAAEGLRFEQFCVNSPICSPSRTAISTGQYPQRWRIGSYLDNRRRNEERGVAQWLDPAAPMLARRLHEAGYATGHFGKWHMGGQRDVGDAPLITEYGFEESLTNFEGLGPRVLPLCDAFDGRTPRRHALGSDLLGRGEIRWEDRSRVTAAFVAGALRFIRRAEAAGRPFYLNLWPDDVHSPFFPPRERRGNGSPRDLYLGVLRTMDEQLGSLFDHLQESERLRRNTLVLVCSDNGPAPGAGSAGPFRGHKATLFEGGLRSSLIVWGPGLLPAARAGSVNRESLVSAIDVPPSLLALTGVRPARDTRLDGEALPRVLTGRSSASRKAPLYFRRPPDRDTAFGNRDLPDLAMREGRWKLLCEYDGSEPELYDLETDRGERADLSGRHPDRVLRMTRALVAWHQSLPQDRGATWRPPGER